MQEREGGEGSNCVTKRYVMHACILVRRLLQRVQQQDFKGSPTTSTRTFESKLTFLVLDDTIVIVVGLCHDFQHVLCCQADVCPEHLEHLPGCHLDSSTKVRNSSCYSLAPAQIWDLNAPPPPHVLDTVTDGIDERDSVMKKSSTGIVLLTVASQTCPAITVVDTVL